MNIALVKQSQNDGLEPLYFRQAESRVIMELDNVAHGLKYFGELLAKTKAVQARFALTVQLKTWMMNKPTVQNLLEQYLLELEHTQQNLHLDPHAHEGSVESLCEQLMFLAAVFEQESEIIDQLLFPDTQLVLCD